MNQTNIINNNNFIKKNIAVLFGSRSPEHDISIVTALQVVSALDPTKFNAIPVYIAPNGEWFTGQALLNFSTYMINQEIAKQLQAVTLDLNVNANNKGILLPKKSSFFGTTKPIEFDIALLATHGIHGEDGQLAALMEMANVAYTGMRHFAATILMNKVATKQVLATVNIPVLPHQIIHRPTTGNIFIEPEQLKLILSKDTKFPACVKPCNLGSSIGVAKVNNFEELSTVLPGIFKYDHLALVEPFVENLVEYNISVGIINRILTTSAIEKPKCTQDLLDFKQKYMSTDGGKNNKLGGCKATMPAPNRGMLGLTRELNPPLDPSAESNLRTWAKLAFKAVQGSGFPRIDFLCNNKTGEMWLNEINPCPGSFAFFLWDSLKENPILFTELLNHLLIEAENLHKAQQLPIDPTPIDARLFTRR